MKRLRPAPSPTGEISRAEDAERFGDTVLTTVFHLVVLTVVVATLLASREPLKAREVALLLLAAASYAAFPTLMARLGAWGDPDGHETDAYHATWRGRLLFFFGFLPIGLFFAYWALTIAKASFFPILPLFVLAGYSSTLFRFAGTILCTGLILAGFQLVMKAVHDFWFPWTDLFSIGVGLIVFNIVFLIANSAVRARRKSEQLASALEASNTKLRDYALRIEDLAVAEERTRLAREIHDSLGHALTVINVQIEAARTVLDTDREKAVAALEAAQAYTRQGLKEVRAAVSSLRASPLASKTLPAAIADLVKQAETSGLAAGFAVRGTPRPLPPALALTLHRAAQESVTNVLRHAQARRLEVVLDFEAADSVRLSIEDDGVGADPRALNGYGLLGLRERVGHHRGESSIRTAPGEGFRLDVLLPLP
jgi:signal transduction histidine kinase